MSILDQAITPRRPVQRDDDSAMSSLSLLVLNSARRDSPLESTLPPFIPALRIDGQSLPQGKCITSASEGQELHLHTNQVIKDLHRSLSPILDLTIISGERIARRMRCRRFQRLKMPNAFFRMSRSISTCFSCRRSCSTSCSVAGGSVREARFHRWIRFSLIPSAWATERAV